MRVTHPILTVIVPMFNESRTIVSLLEMVIKSEYSKQIIIVDDGCNDDSKEKVKNFINKFTNKNENILMLSHPLNLGKGSAIRTALPYIKGKIVLVQDADLECDPADYPKLVEPILQGASRVVFGSRYLGPGVRSSWTPGRVFVLMANILVLILYGRRITDEAGCYKVMETDLLISLNLRCRRFEFCPEVIAKLCRLGIAFHEVPVSYSPRDTKSGKKIGVRDAFEAIATLIRWRLGSF